MKTCLVALLFSVGVTVLAHADAAFQQEKLGAGPGVLGWPATTPCMVVGEVSWAKEDMEPKIRLATGCPIQVQRDGRYIKLSSAKWRVEIVIPEVPSLQGFLYVWGQGMATIGNRTVKVAYGPVDGI